MKDSIVKIRINSDMKELWKSWGSSTIENLNLTQLVTLAVEYFTTGAARRDGVSITGRIGRNDDEVKAAINEDIELNREDVKKFYDLLAEEISKVEGQL